MILIEPRADDSPIVREVSTPHFLRLGAAEASWAGDPIPGSVDEAAAYFRQYSPRFWCFYSAEAADLWAEQFTGPESDTLRHAARYFLASSVHRPGRGAPVSYESASG